MSTDRSDALHYAWQADAGRFDYFMASLSGALAGYVGQSLTVTSFGLNGATAELGALSCFASSFLCALRRIELVTTAKRVNAQQLYHHEVAGTSLNASKHPRALNEATGELVTSQQLQSRAIEHRKLADEAEALLDKLADASERWYSARNALLGIGIVALVVARLLPALGRP